MKKILLILVLLAGSYLLQAQTLLKPLDSTSLKSPDTFNQLKPNGKPLMDQYFSLPSLKASPLIASTRPADGIPFASRMPVLKVKSDDRMPVAKMSSSDHMTVVVLKPVDPLKPVNP